MKVLDADDREIELRDMDEDDSIVNIEAANAEAQRLAQKFAADGAEATAAPKTDEVVNLSDAD